LPQILAPWPRAAQTVQWQQLRDAGFSNADLHIDALVLLLRKA
jgi:hypothetical protein